MRPGLAGPAQVATRVRRPLGPEVTARLLIAVLLAAVQVVGTLATAPSQVHRPFPDAPVAALLLVAGPATFAASRRSVVRAVVATASAAAYLALGYPAGAIGLTAVLGLLLAVLAGRQIEAWLVMASGVVGALVASRFGDHPLPVAGTLQAAGWLVALLALAEVLRARRDVGSVWSRARAQLRLRRAGEQRVEIARDLQGDVAHGLQLTAAHAAAGLALLDVDGARGAAQARAALLAIRDVADDALTELRVVTEVLTTRGEQVPRPQPPGLEALTPLARRWAGTGLVVRAAGDPGPLPPVVDQLAFRVVQEALANVARHSCALNADLALHRDGDLLTLVVSDPGPPRMGVPAHDEAFLPGLGPELDGDLPPGSAAQGGAAQGGAGSLAAGDWRVATTDWDATWPTPGGGKREGGLNRMRERVEVLGGAVSAGPDGAGWCVHVVLPAAPPSGP
jgi:signal transduction histidine kinase